MKKFCEGCGHPLEDNAQFCDNCGRKVSGKCLHCGSAMAPGELFCSKCGTRAGAAAPAPKPVQAQAPAQPVPQASAQPRSAQAPAPQVIAQPKPIQAQVKPVPQPKKKSKAGLVIGLCVGGVALIVLAIVLVPLLTTKPVVLNASPMPICFHHTACRRRLPTGCRCGSTAIWTWCPARWSRRYPGPSR